MIKESTYDDKPCILAFFNDEMEACDEKDATLVKVIFADGSNLFVLPQDVIDKAQAA